MEGFINKDVTGALSFGMVAFGVLLFVHITKFVESSNALPKKKVLTHSKGSFLLKPVDTSSLVYQVLEEYKANLIQRETNSNLLLKTIAASQQRKSTEDISNDLINHHGSFMGPNLSLFYKQEGGLLVEKGSGCYMV